MLAKAMRVLCVLTLLWRRGAADLCDWHGSGFAGTMDSRIVLQVRLRCTQGSVRWIYPGQALRVALEPNLSSARHSVVCIKPWPSLRGASVFVERGGELELLPTPGSRVFCLQPNGPRWPAVYLQSRPSDGAWSRHLIGFRYEVLNNRSAAPVLRHGGLDASCRPCNDTEVLMAACSSDFVARGSIRKVSHISARQTSLVEVAATRVYWQRGRVFRRTSATSGSPQLAPYWQGHVHTFLSCHVKAGGGEFLFMGSEHFGEAWLGCAPRFKDFLSVYKTAWAAQRNSCDFPLN